MKIGYFGDGPWAHQAFELILKDQRFDVRFVCARFEHPDPVLETMAISKNIPFLSHQNINNPEFSKNISKYNCDIFVSMSFDQIFKRMIIETPRYGTINCHAGKLPFYRGRNVLNWALINDEKEFGVTAHFMDEGIDTGDIVHQKTFAINEGDNYQSLLQKAYSGCAQTLLAALLQIENGTATRTPQSSIHPWGSYCSKRMEGDERINWNQTSRKIFNFVRALCHPGPVARTQVRGKELKVHKIEYLPDAVEYLGIPGSVLGVSDEGILVKTMDTFIRIIKVEPLTRLRVGDRLS